MVNNLRPQGWANGLLQDFLLLAAVSGCGENPVSAGAVVFPTSWLPQSFSFDPALAWDFKLICCKGGDPNVCCTGLGFDLLPPRSAALPPRLPFPTAATGQRLPSGGTGSLRPCARLSPRGRFMLEKQRMPLPLPSLSQAGTQSPQWLSQLLVGANLRKNSWALKKGNPLTCCLFLLSFVRAGEIRKDGGVTPDGRVELSKF